jgi:hypothetical protein
VSAVPWQVWAVLAALIGAAGGFAALCLNAPDEHDVWDGGEPRERGIRVNPGREEF